MMDTLTSEQLVHDRFAETFDLKNVLVEEYFTIPSCPENRFIMSLLPDLRGKQVLDIGTGTGESAVFFAKRGAIVTAIDISEGMLAVAKRLANLHGVTIEAIHMDGGALNFPANSFDIVYGANVLHHVHTEAALKKVHEILRVGGTAAFWDPLAYNPVINVYRMIAHQVRSPDEHPLRVKDLRLMRRLFQRVDFEFFWLSTLAVFLKYYFYDLIHPNEERYWKKIIYDYKSVQGLYEPLESLDRVLKLLPGFRWMAWNVAVVLRK